MAFSASLVIECQSGGSDSNGLGFDPGLTSIAMASDGSITSATTASPVISSASYNFTSGDINAFVYLKSGSNVTPGWYQITSVASNQATLNATSGSAVLSTGIPTTSTGCGTASTLSSVVWTVDYSQQSSAQIAYTDIVIGSTTTQGTSSAHPFAVNLIGNLINIQSGSGFTVQRVGIVSISGSTATFDKSLGTASSTGGTGNLGGCAASPGICGSLAVGGSTIHVKQATYSITSASTNVSNGTPSLPAGTTANMTRLIGYNTVRGDYGTKPILQASGISTFVLVTMATTGNSLTANLDLNGASLTSSRAISTGTVNVVYKCKIRNCSNKGVSGASANVLCIQCEATGNSSNSFDGISIFGCSAHDNTATGYNTATGGCIAADCISCNNTGASSDGFSSSVSANFCLYNCIAYGNGRDGYRVTSGGNTTNFFNCIAENNSGWGYNSSSATGGSYLFNCAGFNNTSGLVNTSNLLTNQVIGLVTCTAEIFTNAGSNDFSLNNKANGGILCRAAGIPSSFTGLSTNIYMDIGLPHKYSVITGMDMIGGMTG